MKEHCWVDEISPGWDPPKKRLPGHVLPAPDSPEVLSDHRAVMLSEASLLSQAFLKGCFLFHLDIGRKRL